METVRLERIETDKAEVYVLDDFLTQEECDRFIEIIDANSVRSSVVADNASGADLSDFRTSSSSFFDMNNSFIKNINERMHRVLPEFIPTDQAEAPQGQKYEPGQFFNDHTDYFDKSSGHGYEVGIGSMGQRNWTMLIYLNDVKDGGETEFPRLGLKFQPKMGQAILWKNTDDDGNGNYETLHAGRPVKSGVKYVITKWFRDGKVDANPLDGRLEEPVKVEKFELKELPADVKTFSVKEDLPLFTETGFKVIDLPSDIWGYIQDIYHLIKHTEIDEPDMGVISSPTPGERTVVGIMNMDQVPFLKRQLHKMIQPVMEEWSGYELEPATCYGIRSYRRGSILDQHYDRVEELHVSGIILVDELSDKPWALEIQGHNGEWESIVIKPGQMILYESARCSHGRNEPFEGEYFRNFFIHYKLKNWIHV